MTFNCTLKEFVVRSPFSQPIRCGHLVLGTELRVFLDGHLGRSPNVGRDIVDGGTVTKDGSTSKTRKRWCSELAKERNILCWFMEVLERDGFVVDFAASSGKILFVCETDNLRDSDEVQSFPKSASSGVVGCKGEFSEGNMVKSWFVVKGA